MVAGLTRSRRKRFYTEYLGSQTWKERREFALNKAGYRCQRCGTVKGLQVHHLTYARLAREQEGDLIVLCRACHEQEHEIYKDKDMIDFNPTKPDLRLEFLLDQAIQAENAKEAPRQYLGASVIGDNCMRKLQFAFLQTSKDKPFSGKALRIFFRGHQGEEWMISWLRAAGFNLSTQKPDGNQHGFFTAGGRFGGHCDGIFIGGPGAFGPYPRLWETKVLGAKGWNKVFKDKVKAAYPHYYAQIQIYMAYLNLAENPALFTALNADTMEVYAEAIPFDQTVAQAMSDKAVKILQSCEAGQLLPRVATREDWFECKFCDYAQWCWHGCED